MRSTLLPITKMGNRSLAGSSKSVTATGASRCLATSRIRPAAAASKKTANRVGGPAAAESPPQLDGPPQSPYPATGQPCSESPATPPRLSDLSRSATTAVGVGDQGDQSGDGRLVVRAVRLQQIV